MSKLTHEQKVELLAKNICKMVGFEHTDSTDGSPNWWMFTEQAKKLIDDLESRNFKVWDYIDLKPRDSEQPAQEEARHDP